jgi:hypothetical protein
MLEEHLAFNYAVMEANMRPGKKLTDLGLEE